MLKFRAIMISLIIGIKFHCSDFEPKLIFKLGSSQKKNGNNLEKNILGHYISCQTPAFKISSIKCFQKPSAVMLTRIICILPRAGYPV